MPRNETLPPIAVTMGEPAGIGGELTLMAWARRAPDALPFVALDDAGRLHALAEAVGMAVPVERVRNAADAVAAFDRALPVIDTPLPTPATPGRPSKATASAVIESIRGAVALVQDGACSAVVTNPIQKKPLYEAGFEHPGHTEFLGHLAGGNTRPVMMLACRQLRVVPVTVHLPLSQVPGALTADGIVHAGRVAAEALSRDFGITEPRLAVAALNPHAGEGGTIGTEEIEIIVPAIERLRGEGIAVAGPHAADSMFHDAARRQFDAALCMYHDQALIPLKTIDFDSGVNVTLGLPFIRTSPDHGTALDIAGTGQANPASLLAALDMAATMARHRRAADG